MAYSRAISIWEQTALGKQDISLPKPKEATDEERERMAKDIVRYTLLDLLGWEYPEVAISHVTHDTIKALHLDKVLRYIRFPSDCCSEDWDYKIAVSLDYPYNVKRQLVRYWEKICNGVLRKFPKNFFTGPKGQEKAAYLLGEFVSRNLPFDGISSSRTEKMKVLYQKFSDYATMNAALKKSEIYDVCQRLYNNPLEFLHYSLPKEDQSTFLFAMGEYINVLNATQKSLQKKGA